MKTLLLMRHAKSDTHGHNGDDFLRPLNPRGEHAAPQMGRLMCERGWSVDFVHCSTAARARQTWEGIAAGLTQCADSRKRESDCPPLPPTVFHDRLYLSAPQTIINVIRETPPTCDTALVIAHNPGLANLARRLCGAGSDARGVDAISHKYPTAALSVIVIESSTWRDLDIAPSRLIAFIRPADLSASHDGARAPLPSRGDPVKVALTEDEHGSPAQATNRTRKMR